MEKSVPGSLDDSILTREKMKMHSMTTPFFFLLLAIGSLASHPLAAGPFPDDLTPVRENQEARVRGIVNAVVFPVPDVFEMGASESGIVLITPLPLEAHGEDLDGNEIHESGLTVFQLAGDESVLAQCQKLAGKPVEITADLMTAHSRHHHTPFLLIVKKVRAL